MLDLRQGFVVWLSDIGRPIVYFIVELPGGVGGVYYCELTTRQAVEKNRMESVKRGYSVIETLEGETTIITMLPPEWDREATIEAVDVYADLMIAANEPSDDGGFNVN